MQFNLIHELGHSLFHLSHSNPETRSVMNYKPSRDDVKAPKFTDKELDLIRANVLMREGDKLDNVQDYSHAIDKYYEALKLDPNCFLCYYQLSCVFRSNSGSHSGAIQAPVPLQFRPPFRSISGTL